jgi:drug/metabolite transporter (DMT)-like permease
VNKFWFYVGLYLTGVFISAVAQMMLKKSSSQKASCNIFTVMQKCMPNFYDRLRHSSNKLVIMVRHNKSLIAEYLNPFTIFAYCVLVVATLLTICSYTEVPLSMAPILGASEYFFVAALSRAVLGEKISPQRVIGLCVIVIGILVYSAEKILPSLFR